jgi:hypothetical protein
MLAVLLLTCSVTAWASQNGSNNNHDNVSVSGGVYGDTSVGGDVYEDEKQEVEEIQTTLRERIRNKAEAKQLRERIRQRIKNPAERLALWEELKAMCEDPEEAAATVAEMIYDNPRDINNYKEFARLWRHRHKEKVICFAFGRKMEFDVPPQIVNGRTLMPIRAIAQKLGAGVDWNPKTRTITIRKGDKVIVLAVDKPNARVNGKLVKLDVPPKIINNRTMIPLRFVAENLDVNVTWVAEAQTVVINN